MTRFFSNEILLETEQQRYELLYCLSHQDLIKSMIARGLQLSGVLWALTSTGPSREK
jgi:translation elongation factor EF-Tu-like GTPase